MKLTSRLVSGAVALAMAGALPAWAQTASLGSQPVPDAASGTLPAGKHSAPAARHSQSKPAAMHLASAADAPAAAQGSGSQQGSPALQEVVVTGIRQSME